MSISQQIQTKLGNKFMVRSLIATSFVGLSLIFSMTNTKAASKNFEQKQDPQRFNQEVLIANRQNQGDPIYYYYEGAKYMNAGQYSQAINYYNQAIQINPNFAEAYHNRGYTYGMAKQYQKAIADLEIAIKLYRQQNNIAELKKAQKIIRLIYVEIDKANNPPRNVNVERSVDRQMRKWCDNLIQNAYVTCYGNQP